MEKLIELLNEFEKEVYAEEHEYIRFPDGSWTEGNYWFEGRGNMGENDGLNYSGGYNYRQTNSDLVVISKKFGFIKWLVENDKIDVKELEKSDRPFDVGYTTEETLYERVLMLLSIQDEPIQFLISILK